jgi:uncharacterized protein YeaO (DUF488 family)
MSVRPFVRKRGGAVELRLTTGEADLVRASLDDLRVRLEEAEPSAELRRLFPPAYQDDAEAEAEFVELTRDELRDGKQQAVRSALATLERSTSKRGMLAATLDDDEQQAWLGVLNDMRLYLGTRLGVTDEAGDLELPPSDPRFAATQLYLYLGWLEEHLVEVLLG